MSEYYWNHFTGQGQPSVPAVPAVYVFGDSIVDVGNNQHIWDNLLRVDFPYYGIDYPAGPTGRFSNGKNAADWLAEKVGLPTSPPYLSKPSDIFLQGVSFASGGSGLFNHTGQEFLVKTLSLATQVDYFTTLPGRLVTQLGPEGAEEHLSKSLFLVVTGNNDIFQFFGSGSGSCYGEVTPQQYIDNMISILQGLLKQLYSWGARKFVVVGLGSIGCCPVNRLDSSTEDCNQDMNKMAMNYNKNLTSMLGGLNSDLNDFNYSYFDTYTVLLDIIENSTTYGFKEAKAACCGSGELNAKGICLEPFATLCDNRTDHVFWDKYHPTETAAGLLVDAIYSGTQPEVSPINVEQLIALTTLSSL